MHIQYSIIKYRKDAIALYPLANHQSEVKLIHSEKVHATIAED